jgi:SAM-dependent methyltransferase
MREAGRAKSVTENGPYLSRGQSYFAVDPTTPPSAMTAFSFLVAMKHRVGADPFGRAEVAAWATDHISAGKSDSAAILDVGLGGAQDLLQIRSTISDRPIKLYGIECQPHRVKEARASGISVFDINIEKDAFPLADASLDVVMANHVIEHLKEIFFFFSEVSRVLKPGGLAIIGFPNLGGWHNRAALLFGRQPPCMRVLGSHVRGFTIPGFKQFIEREGFFKVEQIKGRAFLLAPGGLSSRLASMFPGLGSAVHFVIRRTGKPGSFIEVLDSGVEGIGDTPYFRGPLRSPLQEHAAGQ